MNPANSQPELFKTPKPGSTTPEAIIVSGEPLVTIIIPGRLPSWNEILGMEQWARYKFKGELASVFLSVLEATEGDCSTRITSAVSSTLTYSATLRSYLRTRQEQRKLRSARKRLAAKNASLSELKFTKSKPPF